MKTVLDEASIIRALERLSELLHEKGTQGEVCLLGGTVMVLAFKARPATRDVDAIFHPPQLIRELARKVQEEQGLPDNWLNDSAKGYVSAAHETQEGDLPQFESLRLLAPTPQYLLAMKCMASRIASQGSERSDVGDIEFLLRHLDLKNAEEALAIVEQYYPRNQIPVRAQFLLEDIFSEMRKGERI
jgi:hypothetical protein